VKLWALSQYNAMANTAVNITGTYKHTNIVYFTATTLSAGINKSCIYVQLLSMKT